ncbi:MAG: aldo/keto reductase [Planctomycetota bacterium]|nr:aldo/keto reductase [Planctomycetota bacterium]
MKYRTLGKNKTSVSALGFGAMRLPTTGREAEVDEPAAIEMIRCAVDSGVNYIDTAYVYHGGNSEVVIGKALAGGYREKVAVATKLPIWHVASLADCDRLFQEQLTRLQTDHIDFYLLHCLQKKSWSKMRDIGVLEWAEHAQRSGRIGELGFSFHDGYEAFVDIVNGFDWSLCQIQYNYVNEDVQAGTQGLKYAAAKGLGVVIMEPLFGGTLANPPEPIQDIWGSIDPQRSPVDLALRWLWNKPEVSLVLSGMSTLEQVQQNVESACRSGIGLLNQQEMDLIARAQEAYKALSPIPCTKCGYCLPCPNGVNIPNNFELYNHATLFKGSSAVLCRNLYHSLSEAERASACLDCGTCEEKCPQQIPVGTMLRQVSEQFK